MENLFGRVRGLLVLGGITAMRFQVQGCGTQRTAGMPTCRWVSIQQPRDARQIEAFVDKTRAGVAELVRWRLPLNRRFKMIQMRIRIDCHYLGRVPKSQMQWLPWTPDPVGRITAGCRFCTRLGGSTKYQGGRRRVTT
jgi:hypothetical protein